MPSRYTPEYSTIVYDYASGTFMPMNRRSEFGPEAVSLVTNFLSS